MVQFTSVIVGDGNSRRSPACDRVYGVGLAAPDVLFDEKVCASDT